ncbi:SHOCT domain-containing protein [Kribbella sancticallisti]|uniref:SHOCT domain-containing protein n=1 Tax=Kribbella sancticallisti TaxID=460087 RepID=UPI003CD0AD33
MRRSVIRASGRRWRPRRSRSGCPSRRLAKLGELHSAGVLTDTEFTAKKAELLGRI